MAQPELSGNRRSGAENATTRSVRTAEQTIARNTTLLVWAVVWVPLGAAALEPDLIPPSGRYPWNVAEQRDPINALADRPTEAQPEAKPVLTASVGVGAVVGRRCGRSSSWWVVVVGCGRSR
jgi:hypothetical protein